MTGLVRKATIFAVLGLLAASAAFAGVPSCGHSTFPTYVDLVGCTTIGGTTPDANGTFTVTVRDVGDFPVANQLVSIQFGPDVAVYNTNPGYTGTCCVEATTDINGVATFRISGAGRNPNGTASFIGANMARIFFGSCATAGWCVVANVCTFDENGAVSTKGVEVTDLSAWVSDYNQRLTPPLRPRSDFNHNGSLDVVDLSYWVRVYNGGQSKSCSGTLVSCPAF